MLAVYETDVKLSIDDIIFWYMASIDDSLQN